MNLIITSQLSSDPPSEGLYFRFLTMMANKELNYEVVLESPEEMVDTHWKFLKTKGWFDFVDDIVVPQWRVEGVRLDTEHDYPLTICTPYIRCENTPVLLGQLKSIRGIKGG